MRRSACTAAEVSVGGSASGALRVLIGAEETRPYWSSTPRGASNGGATFHDRGGPYGRTNGDERVVAVDATGFRWAPW